MYLGLNRMISRGLASIEVTLSHVLSQIREMKAPEIPMDLLQNCKVFSSRKELLPHLTKGGIVGEVGVAYGDFTELMLSALEPRKFMAIDTFQINVGNEPSWGKLRLATSGKAHREFYESRFADQIATGMLEIRQGLS